MEMLLMGLCMAVFGVAFAALAFGAATRSESSEFSCAARASVGQGGLPRPAFSRTVLPVPPAVPPRAGAH